MILTLHKPFPTASGSAFALLSLLILLLLLVSSCGDKFEVQIENLKTDHGSKVLGMESATPFLSWQTSSSGQDIRQSGYQILVASSEEKLNEQEADLWNSGKVKSDQSAHIPYGGKALASGERAYWKLQIWDQHNRKSGYSESSWWEMGLLNKEDWRGQWISAQEPAQRKSIQSNSATVPPVLPSPYFRKTFAIEGNIKKARLYISGLGYYETFINGEKVGDHVLDPMLTRYDKRVNYVTYDVTSAVKKGNNAVGVVLGNGWYNQHSPRPWKFNKAPWRASPALLYQLEITDEAGKRQIVKSDESWKVARGPILYNSISNGETYDARLELGEWTSEAYEEEGTEIRTEKGNKKAGWTSAVAVKGPDGELSSQLMPPIRVKTSIKPFKRWNPNDSDTLLMVDLDQNITGWASIKVKGPEGSRVRVRYGERIYDDGTLDQEELSRFIRKGDTQTDQYILKGQGEETWHPVFVYHGFQYIELSFSDPAIELVDVQGEVVHTDLQRKGYFRSSNDMFNQLQENISWSFLGNYHGYPTDCPHREKIGWTGDALLVAETGMFNFDMVQAYLKWTDDFMDEQQASGQVPGIIPTSGWGYAFGNDENRDRGYGPQWEGAFMEIPWQVYRYTGDTTVLTKYYSGFKKYVDYLSANAKNHLLDFGIDDHKQLAPLTREDYLSSAFYYYFSDMLRQMAAATGNREDEQQYAALSGKVKSAFNARYYDEETGLYDHGGQTPLALALHFGLVEETEEERVLVNLLGEIQAKDGHIDAGVVGTKALINTLLKYGQEQVLFEMANKRTFPGWGYWVDELGANTMYQNWDGSQSRNHIMFGSIGDYFFKGLAGIRIDDQQPGFKHFIINPSFDNDIDWVESGYETMYGEIGVDWKKEAEHLSMNISIPPNSTAELWLPAAGSLRLNGKEIRGESLEKISNRGGNFIRHRLGSGEHHLTMKY